MHKIFIKKTKHWEKFKKNYIIGVIYYVHGLEKYCKHVSSAQTDTLIQWHSNQNSSKRFKMKIKIILKMYVDMQKAKKNQNNLQDERSRGLTVPDIKTYY